MYSNKKMIHINNLLISNAKFSYWSKFLTKLDHKGSTCAPKHDYLETKSPKTEPSVSILSDTLKSVFNNSNRMKKFQ